MPSRLDRIGRRSEELEQLLDAAFGEALAKEQAAGDRVSADDVALLMGLVPVRQEHRQVDEGVDPPVELVSVRDRSTAQRALDDLRP